MSLGLDKAGYRFVNLDDCWLTDYRDQNGRLVADPVAFPSGMKALADYIHSKGLLFGMYSSAGTHSCLHRIGSLGNEEIDAQDFASWEIDYLKYDNCNSNGVSAKIKFPAMRDALNKTGRPIFFSACNWGDEDLPEWGQDVANSWRTTQDIFDAWVSVEYNFATNDMFHEKAMPGAWNDPDMLEVGNGQMTIQEEKTHFALWAIAKGPLIIGSDLSALRQESLDILLNKEIIAVNQDTLGKQGTCMVNCGFIDRLLRRPSVIAAPLANGDIVALIVNWRELNYGYFEFDMSLIGITPNEDEEVEVRDLWNHQTLGKFKGGMYKVEAIPGHGNHALRFHLVKALSAQK